MLSCFVILKVQVKNQMALQGFFSIIVLYNNIYSLCAVIQRALQQVFKLKDLQGSPLFCRFYHKIFSENRHFEKYSKHNIRCF